MKLILLLNLTLSLDADLIGYNRQRSVADHARLNVQNNKSVQDQIIQHLIKNGLYKQLRSYLAKIKSVQKQEILQRLKN